jgi:hypothetical protein
MNIMNKNNLKRSLQMSGAVQLSSILNRRDINYLEIHSRNLIDSQSRTNKEQLASIGSLISINALSEFTSTILHPKIDTVLKSIGGNDLRFAGGYIVNKPANSPASFWHQDWWCWQHPISYTATLVQVGILIYLTKTSTQNGCLRIIPGTHQSHHPLHDILATYSRKELREAQMKDTTPYDSQTDEIAINCQPGDIIIIDPRLLHGAYANTSSSNRPAIVLWYYPNYGKIPKEIRASIIPADSTGDVPKELHPFMTRYNGSLAPLEMNWHPQFSK